MRKFILTLISAPFVSLGIVGSASAFNPIDERFPDQRIIIPTIAPADNYLYLQNNDQDANSPSVRLISFFTSDTEWSAEQVKENSRWQPDGTVSAAFLFLSQDQPAQLSGGSTYVSAQDGFNLTADRINGILYYAIDFTDGTLLMTHKVDYSNCLKAADGDLIGVECRAEAKGDDIIYAAYRDGVRIEYEETPISQSVIDASEDDNPPDYTEVMFDTPTQDAQLAAPIEAVKEAIVSNSSSKNVKNTETDELAAAAGMATTNAGALPPSTPSASVSTLGSSSVATTQSGITTPKQLYWWAILPLATVTGVLFWFFFIFPKKKQQEEEMALA